MSKNKSRLISIILCLVLAVSALTLVACDKDTFTNPAMPATGEVGSNGGIAVTYGDYIYYVNGYQSVASMPNKYTGYPKTGDIVRINAEDLAAAMALQDNKEIAAADLADEVAKAIFANSEVVVPMFVFSGLTTANENVGLYIYNDMLYFTTPNPELTTGGNTQTNKLSVYNCKLDGTALTNLYSADANTMEMVLTQVGTEVYAMYTTDALYAVKLSDGTVTTVAEKATQAKYDVATATAFYVTEEGELASYTCGKEEVVLLANEDSKNLTYTISSINDGTVYFSMSKGNPGLLAITAGDDTYTVVYNSVKDAQGTAYSMLPYGENVVMVSKIADTDAVQLYITNADNTVNTYILPKNSNQSAITLNAIKGDILSYTIDSVLYEVDLSAASYSPVEVSATVTATGWGATDKVEVAGTTYFFNFTAAYGVEAIAYVEKDGEMINKTVNVTVYDPAEFDEEK